MVLIFVRATGSGAVPGPEPGPVAVAAVPGNVATGALIARGGAGHGTDPDDGSAGLGGAGGSVTVETNVTETLVVGETEITDTEDPYFEDFVSIDTRGGGGVGSGGDAGSVTVTATGRAETPVTYGPDPADPQGDLIPIRGGTPAVKAAVTLTGDVLATGGTGAGADIDDVGGDGGPVEVTSTAGESLVVAAIDTSGGDGGQGGSAGLVKLTAHGSPATAPELDSDDRVTRDGIAAVATRLEVTGNLKATGGATTSDIPAEDGVFAGGDGARIEAVASVGSVDVGSNGTVEIDTSGGNGIEQAGSAGAIWLSAEGQEAVVGGEADVIGDVTLDAMLTALGGGSRPDVGQDGADGAIEVEADDGILGGVSVDQDLTLRSATIGDSLDADGRFRIEEGDRDDSTLTMIAGGPVGVDVTGAFGKIDLTQRDAGGGGAITQSDGGVADSIQIEGVSTVVEEMGVGEEVYDEVTPGRSTIVRAETGTGVDWIYRLEDSVEARPEGGGDLVTYEAELEIGPVAMILAGDTEVIPAGDTVISNLGDITLKDRSATIGDGASLTLRADANGDGAGSIAAEGTDPHIVTSGDVTLEGMSIGEDLELIVGGAGGEGNVLAVIADGFVGIDLQDPTDDQTVFDVISVTQRDAGSDVLIDQLRPGSASDPQGIWYALPDVDATTRELNVDTRESNIGIEFILADTEGLQDLEIREAILGGSSLFASTGSILRASDPGDPEAVIDATTGGPLLLVAGGSVGTETRPIATVGLGDVAGATANGGFFLENIGSGDLRIAHVTIPDGSAAVSGISAGGDVVLTNIDEDTQDQIIPGLVFAAFPPSPKVPT